MKLWVDDIRPPPDDSWTWTKTSRQAISILAQGQVETMSLDHDLGGAKDTRGIVFQLILWAERGDDKWPSVIDVHSRNNAGAKWLREMIKRYRP